MREVTLITAKRIRIQKRRSEAGTGQLDYGHWWFEIGTSSDPGSESYGWWPSKRVSLVETLSGVPGVLNGQGAFPGTSNRDPHHGDDADEVFHPVVPDTDARTDEEIAECLRSFADSFSGEWRWRPGGGRNCQTFQADAFQHCGLKVPSRARTLSKGAS